MDTQKETFSYTYSARQQDEVRKIYNLYMTKEENSIEKLKRLDRSATRIAGVVSVTVGTIGFLVIAVGMCYMMLWSNYSLMGLVIAVPGLVATIAARPLYRLIVAKRRKKIAPEVLKLCNELMK